MQASGIIRHNDEKTKHNMHKSHGLEAFHHVHPDHHLHLTYLAKPNSTRAHPQYPPVSTMSHQSYNESQIIALITEYYHLLISLHYITLDCIDFPPPQGRETSLPLCESPNLTPEVISLMKYLPCPIDEHVMLDHEFLLLNSYGNSFCSERLIRMGRDPEIGEREGWLQNTDIAITIMGDEGQYLVLDTAGSKSIPCLNTPFLQDQC
jgi:hypothetical protein